MNKHRIAIITARGGSKRIPGKNIKSFYGKPIICYSIEAALKSNEFDTVMVSTDDETIADVAVKHGADVPFFRSAKTADDYATLTDVVTEVIHEYRNTGANYTEACCILPTAPFIKADNIKLAFNLLVQSALNCVLPVTKFSYPIQRSLRINNNGRAEMLWPENYTSRSQDLEPVYHDVGQFYCFNVNEILREQRFYTTKTGIIELSNLEVQDIDSEEDWQLAELKFQYLKSKNML